MAARRPAVVALSSAPGHVLVDGKHRIAGCRLAQTPVDDGRSSSIAAAAIVAKMMRDSMMAEYGRLWPCDR